MTIESGERAARAGALSRSSERGRPPTRPLAAQGLNNGDPLTLEEMVCARMRSHAGDAERGR